MALTERLANYTGWLALAVTCHPLVTLRTRPLINTGAKWTLVLAGLLTTASLFLAALIEPSIQAPLTRDSASLQEVVVWSRSLLPHLSWLWGCGAWLGLLALFGPGPLPRRRGVAWSALCVAAACGLFVNLMRLGIAISTQVPW